MFPTTHIASSCKLMDVKVKRYETIKRIGLYLTASAFEVALQQGWVTFDHSDIWVKL
jgi:hypothetical protein